MGLWLAYHKSGLVWHTNIAANSFGAVSVAYPLLGDHHQVLASYIKNELRFVYEAGPCGYGIYRYLTQNDIECVVVAPSKIPKQSGNRLKNDKRDCLTLARLHRAGELTPVYVPSSEDEALRDLVRAREDATGALRTAKQQLEHSFFAMTSCIPEEQNGRRLISTGWPISLCRMLHSRSFFKNILIQQ